MFCAISIYCSPNREQTYLYLEKKDDFSRLPGTLLAHFGQPRFVMQISLANRDRLANAEIEKVKSDLVKQGYYLQMPPTAENLLKTHLVAMEKVTE